MTLRITTAAALTSALLGGAAAAQDLEFYFPVAVGGGPAEVIQSLVDRYEAATPGVSIEAIYTGSYTDTNTKAMTAARAGQAPTMAVLLATGVFQLHDEDMIEPISAHLTEEELNDWIGAFYPAFVGKIGDEVYSVPFQRSTPIMFWNKEAFAEAGLDPETPPANWDQLVEMGKALTKRDANGNVTQWGFRVPSAGYPIWLFQGFSATNGVALNSNDAGTAVKFDDPAVIEALQFQYDLAHKHEIMAKGGIDWGATVPAFFEGESAMVWTTTGNLTNVRENAPFEFGVAQLPANVRNGAPTGGGNFYIFKGAEEAEIDAAIDFLQWITAPEQAAEWSIATGYIAPRADAWETDAMKAYLAEFPQAATARDQLASAVTELSTYENSRVIRLINDALSSVISGETSAEEALKGAQAEAEKILKPYR